MEIEITSIEQSRKLLEMGISPDTADVWYDIVTPVPKADSDRLLNTKPYWDICVKKPARVNTESENHEILPAWSVGGLLKLLIYDFDKTTNIEITMEKDGSGFLDGTIRDAWDGEFYNNYQCKSLIDLAVDLVLHRERRY